MSPRTPLKTLSTIVRVGKALREPEPESAPPEGLRGAGLRDAAKGAARSLGQRALGSERVQTLRDRAGLLGSAAAEEADRRLERLIAEKRARRGQNTPAEVSALLDARRAERDARLAQTQARQALLSQAETPEQRRVLHLVAARTPWTGGEARALRYTEVLDELAPGGHAEREMAVHRALWTLAERRVLAVSPHGVVTATQTLPNLGRALD